ncbi:hypothetical protein [Micromonospora sp. WMMD1274]|uniref:hypothetical protein n=1 Tax=Micromonospora sp. WMMD1274 TaxID=3404116 RepID=UPI003B92A7DB
MNTVAFIVQLGGAAPFAYAVVVDGIKGECPRNARLWGKAERLSRKKFAAYFGSLGLALSHAVFLLINFRSDDLLMLATGALAVVVIVLLFNWLLRLRR